MLVRFLDLVESEIPDFPFRPGQVADLSSLTPAIRAAIQSGRAALVRVEEPELATVAAGERAVTRGTKRGRRA